MIRSILSYRGPLLVAVFPFNMKSNEQHDRPVSQLIKPLVEDELGWDRVKKIFRLNEHGLMTKELQSILNITFTGIVTGAILGGITHTRNTVNNFISNNEATRFTSHFDARRDLQRQVFLTFIKHGVKLARKLGIFCLMFSTLTTCTTAYRGKLRVENYIVAGSVTGLLHRLNLGLRGSLVGAGVGGTLGGICGGVSILLLYLSGVTIDEVMQVQQDWITSRNEATDSKIRAYMAEREESEVKDLFEENQKRRLQEQKIQEARNKVGNSST